MIYCKECNGEIVFSCYVKRNGTEHELYRCKHCGREILELIKYPGCEYK